MVLSVQLFCRLNYERGWKPISQFSNRAQTLTSHPLQHTTKTSITLLHACLDGAPERDETVKRLILSVSLLISLSLFTLLGSVSLFYHFLSAHLSQFLPASVCFLFLLLHLHRHHFVSGARTFFFLFFIFTFYKHKLTLFEILSILD